MKRSVRPIVVLLFASVVASSCAFYAPPESGPKARIEIKGNRGYAYIDPGNSCETRQMVGREHWAGTDIRAGQRIWIERGIDTSGLAFGYTCGLAFSFIPQEDSSYVVEYDTIGMQCRAGLYRVVNSGVLARETSVQFEKQKHCMY